MTAAPNTTASLGLPVVYLVDDEAVVREALAWLLRSRRLLSEGFASAEAFEAHLPPPAGAAVDPPANAPGAAGPSLQEWPRSPSCLLLDVRMPGMSGPELFERLAARGLLGRLPVIFLTGHGDVPTAVGAVKRGAFDFVEKPFSDNALVDRIEQALALSARALLAERAVLTMRTALQELTEREREVMSLVMEGLPNKLIADELDISVRTVEVHRSRVFDKMGVKSAVELVNLMNAHPPLRAQWAARPGASGARGRDAGA
ncbi:MAG: DNA-binding response regulator [Betaproteobacteria bacterium]|nr:DNA-binding response regulator [Betaproteobacteria bacterium]NBU48824.1 DNA-binding response regulator [Betaproteobacteria bacterium]